MEGLQVAITSILCCPTPESLVELQEALLVSAAPGRNRAHCLEIAHQFHTYLCQLRSKITAKQFSEVASGLDIGAVGIVALENALFAKEEFWERLLVGTMAEGLMVGASRQYIKGWAAEVELVHAEAAWVLTEALWQISLEMRPDSSAEERWQGIQSLLGPIRSQNIADGDRSVLLGRIFQHLLLTYISRLLTQPQD